MTSANDRWEELAASTAGSLGTNRLRVAPWSPHDVFIGVIQPHARRCFWYEVATDAVPHDYRLPDLRSVRITVGAIMETPTTTRVQFELDNADLADVFKAMVNDLVATVGSAPDDDSGLTALSQRAERWRQLLETDGSGGLSAEERRGLAGELIVLGQLIDNTADAKRAVRSWTGPYGKHQDFQAAQAAIEVKTTVTKQPQSLVIASERELDPTGVPHLYLMHVSLDERQGGTGASLNGLVEAVRQHIAGDAIASAMLEDGLLSYGYLSAQTSLYDAPNFSVREQNAFEVRKGFPCVTEHDVPTGVGDVSYRIQLAALPEFAVSLPEALAATVAR